MQGSSSAPLFAAAVVVAAVSIAILVRRRNVPCEAVTAAVAEEEPVVSVEEPGKAPSVKPVAGFLVAAEPPKPGFGGYIPEDAPTGADGPESTDSEDDNGDTVSQSFVIGRGGSKNLREASFRQRSEEKVERAATIKIKSRELTSHLITPAMHNRSVADAIARGEQQPMGSRTIATTPRKIDHTQASGWSGSPFRNKEPEKPPSFSRKKGRSSKSTLDALQTIGGSSKGVKAV